MRREVHLWQRLERGGRVRWGYRRAIIEARMAAGRRGLSRSDPAVELHQGSAQQGPVVDRVGSVLTARVVCGTGIGQQEIARAMLRPRQVVDAHRLRGGQVALAIQVGVGQRGMAAPVLRRGVDEENLRHLTARGQPRQQPIRATGFRVCLRRVVEGEEVFHTILIRVGRLAKALVELAAPATGDQRYQSVKDGPIALVLVQPQIQEVAQESAALRAAEAVGVLDMPRTRIALLSRAVPQEGDHIPHG